MSSALNTFSAALATITLLAFILIGGNHALIESDTRAKLRSAERTLSELNARRAAKYANILAACLNGHPIVEGRRVIACREAR